MYTVGLISEENCLKTHSYNSLEEARKELKDWECCFRNNNVVESSTTMINKNKLEEITGIKIIFELRDSKNYIMFLSKNR